jgi:ATP-dependent helicase YprA (DUF1998 family)
MRPAEAAWRPTPRPGPAPQALAVPAIMTGGDFLVASHTGSGKTLAYLLPVVGARAAPRLAGLPVPLPLPPFAAGPAARPGRRAKTRAPRPQTKTTKQIEQLKRAEAGGAAPRRARRPRVLVLGPTTELVDQLLGVAKSLSHAARFASAGLTSSGPKSDQRAALGAPLDVIFATPGRLLQHNEEGAVHFGDVRWVVVDEADTMILKVGGARPVRGRRPCAGPWWHNFVCLSGVSQ